MNCTRPASWWAFIHPVIHSYLVYSAHLSVRFQKQQYINTLRQSVITWQHTHTLTHTESLSISQFNFFITTASGIQSNINLFPCITDRKSTYKTLKSIFFGNTVQTRGWRQEFRSRWILRRGSSWVCLWVSWQVQVTSGCPCPPIWIWGHPGFQCWLPSLV